jgi:hypothetical protein
LASDHLQPEPVALAEAVSGSLDALPVKQLPFFWFERHFSRQVWKN